MSRLPLPLLSGTDGSTYPARRDGKCPLCRRTFQAAGGLAYLHCSTLYSDESGTMVNSDSVDTEFSIGYHGADVEVRDSVHVTIVESLHHEQFDLNFCSLECLRTWFNSVIDSLARELRARRDAM